MFIPTKEFIIFEIEADEKEKIIKISSIQGQIYPLSLQPVGQNRWEANTSSIPNGVYVVHARVGKRQESIRFVISQ